MSRWLPALGSTMLLLLLIAATATTTVALLNRGPQPATPSETLVRVAVIGDSYSAGADNDVVWPTLLAASSPLSVSDVAARDASYAGGAGQSGRFSGQVDKALASKPQLIVIFGGLADAGLPDEQITQSAVDLLAELARRAPTSKVVVFGPIWHTQPVPAVFIALDAALHRAAQVTFTTYISLIQKDWLVGDGLMQGDAAPTDKGQLVLARRVNPILLEQLQLEQTVVSP
jgi:hypothetical protein